VDTPGDVGFVVRLGHRRPLAHSTSGVVLFAFQNDEVRAHWLDTLGKAGTRYSRKKFVEQADRVRAQGYAALASEAVDGVTDLSAPILRHGYAAGALTIPFVERKPAQMTIKRTIERLRTAVADISRELTA
jgi:DNA-binding IclR family transcriptional regulator